MSSVSSIYGGSKWLVDGKRKETAALVLAVGGIALAIFKSRHSCTHTTIQVETGINDRIFGNIKPDLENPMPIYELFMEQYTLYDKQCQELEKISVSWRNYSFFGQQISDQRDHLGKIALGALQKMNAIFLWFIENHVWAPECLEKFIKAEKMCTKLKLSPSKEIMSWVKHQALFPTSLKLARNKQEKLGWIINSQKDIYGESPENETYTYISPEGTMRKYYMPKKSYGELTHFLTKCDFFKPCYKDDFFDLGAVFYHAILYGIRLRPYLELLLLEKQCYFGQVCTVAALKKSPVQSALDYQKLIDTYPDYSPNEPPSSFGLYHLKSTGECLEPLQKHAKEYLFEYYDQVFFESSKYYAMHIPTEKELVVDYNMSLKDIAEHDFVIFYHSPYNQKDREILSQELLKHFPHASALKMSKTEGLTDHEEITLKAYRRGKTNDTRHLFRWCNNERIEVLAIPQVMKRKSKGVNFQEKACTYFAQNNGAMQQEIAFPLNQEKPDEQEDVNDLVIKTSLWERFLFKAFTGMDLEKIRKYKILHSPRYQQLNKIAASTHPIILQDFSSEDLEAYWVDREFSIYIKNLTVLEEALKKHSLSGDKQQNSYENCIEMDLAKRVFCRLLSPDRTRDFESDYDEITDTFKLVPWEKSKFFDINTLSNNRQRLTKWVYESLKNRLEKDIERRKQDPNCRLDFAKNEMFEKKLMKRKMQVTACWVVGVSALAFISFFFYQNTRSK